MTVWVALLRGVNVGGKNKLPMAELRAALTGVGFDQVSTYIQSGNIMFNADDRADGTAAADDRADGSAAADAHAHAVHRTLVDRFGLDVPVITIPASRLDDIQAANPYPAMTEQPKFLHVYFAQKPVDATAFDDLDHERFHPDEVAAVGGVVYVAYPNGVARSKLTNAVIDRAIGQPATGRNWSTVSKLAELTSDTGSDTE